MGLKFVAGMILIAMTTLLSLSYIPYINNLPTELREGSDAIISDINYYNATKPILVYHTSTFSQSPMKYYLREKLVLNLLKTNLTQQQLFTAGGSVVKDYEIVNNTECDNVCYYVMEKSRYQQQPDDTVIYDSGGLLIIKK